MRTSGRGGYRFDPARSWSLSDELVDVLAEASKTARSLVEVELSLSTAWGQADSMRAASVLQVGPPRRGRE